MNLDILDTTVLSNVRFKWSISIALLLLLSGSSISLPNPSPAPFLLVNKGAINIHDSVQKVGHNHYKSSGGRVRYWSLGASGTEPVTDSRQGKAVIETAEGRGFPNGVIISADSAPSYPQQNTILRRESGFKPSGFPFQGLPNNLNQAQNIPQSSEQLQSKYQAENYRHQAQQLQERHPAPRPVSVVIVSSTIGYGREDQHYQNQPNQLPSITYEDAGGYNNGNIQNQAFRQKNGLNKMMVKLKGRFNKAMSTVKNVFKSFMYKRPKQKRRQVQRPGQGRKEFGGAQGQGQRNGILELDFWDLASPMRRLYRWFNGSNNLGIA